ncbi:MAG TPA: hypothetical protein VMU69_26385, partial [Bradyrhizobium sp.]|nr:hypothetical protein [Bradyrhizobium sp.]
MPLSRISATFLFLIAPFIAPTSVFASSPAASPSALSSPSAFTAATMKPPAQASAKPKTAEEQKPAVSRDVVIPFLNTTIGWYHHLDAEEVVATQPAEMLYLADDRDMAQKVVKFAFDFARAQAALLQAIAPTTTTTAPNSASASVNGVPSTLVPDLSGKLAQLQAQVQ